ncbi:MAG: class I SAM-dependent DNA methyltransferase [Opitutales bacterium]
MAVKKSDLYSSLWASCDELRGGMDASQYKDYVLFMLFIKYISDKYGNSKDFAPPVTVPPGASFKDMIALKGKSDIGDKINTRIIQPLIDANSRLAKSDFPDFNDPNRLGEGKDMVERLSNLIAIFQKPELDFSKNRAENDDILGDAYEYLMRHFASQSGKSKGQFYTPSEVSRIIAKVIGISPKNSKASTTAYDPTCGSGSLLLKVAAEAGKHITLEGQEKDVTTAGLARMNMILHDFPTANILSGNTLSDPKFKDGEQLRTYDYVVANPPFSDKAWSTGLTPTNDPFQRFQWGEPPAKQGDYAYLLHIIRSMKSTGKGACILPHGVLFRGNAEAAIRKKLVRSGILKGIIGLPANLFYGTGIPACILVLDKENDAARRGIFMIDASKGFIKDGNKTRLRERDLHQIVDVFTHAEEHAGYSGLVPHDEIEKNDFNLNLPRYIDTQEAEDIQDIGGHLHGGIPTGDIDALADYWTVCPDLRAALFKPNRPGYHNLLVPAAELKPAIHGHPQFAAFIAGLEKHFAKWAEKAAVELRKLDINSLPKEVIHELSENLLAHAEASPGNATPHVGTPLIDPYAVYQHLMDYWAETMQDDCYIVGADGWVARPQRILETNQKTGKTRDRGWTCDLVPKPLVVARYFAKEQSAIAAQQAALESTSASLAELEEEHGGEEGFLGALDKIAKPEITARLKEIKAEESAERKQSANTPLKVAEDPVPFGSNGRDKSETEILLAWLNLSAEETALRKTIREAEAELDRLAYEQYPRLSVDEIKTLVVDDKWLTTLTAAIQGELDRVSQTLTGRIRLLADRYAAPLPQIVDEVAALAAKVDAHLKKMEAAWK